MIPTPVLAVLLPLAAAAPADSLPIGETVRLLAVDASPVVGTLIDYDEGTFVVRLTNGSYRSLPDVADIRLQVREARPSRAGTGFLVGAGIGLVGGIVVGQVVGDDGGSNTWFDFTPTKSEASLGLGLAGFLVGGGIGALVGASMGGDRWVDVPLSSSPDSGEEVRLGIPVGRETGAALLVRRRF